MTGSKYRNYPGSKGEEYCNWRIKDIQDMEALAVSQYLQLLIRNDPSNVGRLVTLPEATQEELWQYEHLRQLCIDANALSVAIAEECECAEMSTGAEKVFLCAAHPEPKECSALSYCFHTIDHSAGILTNSKTFPSRLLITEESVKHLHSIAKRLYRIFAHAAIHHRPIFLAFEMEHHSFKRFLKLNASTSLIPKDSIGEEDVAGFEEFCQ